ncbi:MAG: Ig-like domain-containing protein, partial [Carboxydocellales bacterium]
MEGYGVEAYFGAAKELTSIEYKISTDGVTWLEPVISYEQELYYSNWRNEWYRYIQINVSTLAEGQFWLQATATDVEGNSISVTTAVKKDTIADNVTGVTAMPNEANDAVVVNWVNPPDLGYVEIYKWVYNSGNSGSGYWDYLGGWNNDISTYTDSDVFAYKTYLYKIVAYDTEWNKAADPPQVYGSLRVDGPIALEEWYGENAGKINANNVINYHITTRFLAAKEITSIDYTYSTDGTSWKTLNPFISYIYPVYNYSSRSEWYRSATLNLSGPYGLADGTYLFRATAADVEGNSLSVERYVYKDSTRPQNVTNFTVEYSPDVNGFVLNWLNPAEGFDYVIVQRDSWILSSNFTGTTYTDANVTAGVPVSYSIIPVDSFGNRAQDPPEVTSVRPVKAPVFSTMSPWEGMSTSGESIYYSAEFIDDKTINSMLFEVSADSHTWYPLNASTTQPNSSYGNRYNLGGTWDIKKVGEAVYQIRVTATDTASQSTTVSRWVYIDRLAPAAPENFTAVSTTNGVYLSWSLDSGVNRYYLTRELDGNYSNSWTINSPNNNFTDQYAQKDKMYIYKLKPFDTVGNEGPVVTTYGQYYSGPRLSLTGGPEVATTLSAYTLSGTTDPGATVTVNSTPVTVDAAGGFIYEVTLSSAVTTLTAAATNAVGTHTSVQKVILDNSIPYVYYLNPADSRVLKGVRSELFAGATDFTGSGVSRIDFQVSTDDGQTWNVIGTLPSDKLNYSSSGYWDSATSKYYPSWTGYYYWDSTVSVGVYAPLAGAYKFRAQAVDKAGNPSNGSPVRIWTIDNQAPAIPANLTATPALEQVTLNWSANTDSDLATYNPYRIYRSTTPGTGYVNIGSSATTTYTDNYVTGGTNYYYVLKVLDKAGNESPYSAEVICQPLPDTVKPTITWAVPAEGSEVGGITVNVRLNATDNSAKGIKAFRYEYSADQGLTWKDMNGYGSGPTWIYYAGTYYGDRNWNTSGLTSGNYRIRITAADNSNNTDSVNRSVNLDVYASPVNNVQAIPGEGAVVLTWAAVADPDCSGYEISKSTYLTGGFNTVSTVGKDILTYTDTAVTLGNSYYYQVSSFDKLGNRSVVSPIVNSRPGDDMTSPVVTLINPANGSVTGGPMVSFYAQATDNKAVTVMNAVYSRDEGKTWENMNVTKSGPTQNGYSPNIYYQTNFTWTTGELPSGAYTIRVTATDAASNSGHADFDWTLDKTVASVVYVSSISGDASIKLDWQPIADADAGGYYIARSASIDGPYKVITG